MLLADLPRKFSSDVGLLNISSENILKGMGMTKPDADEYLRALIEQSIEGCKLLARPCIGFTIVDNPEIDLTNRQLGLNDEVFNTGKIVTSFLKKSESIVVFACTIGHDVELLAKQQMRNNESLEGLITDLIGSELVESLVDYFHDYIESELIKSQIKVSNRFSPGYCGWPVSEQHKLFSVLAKNNCGINVTSSALMLPVKSVSGLIGLGKNIRKLDYKCQLCTSIKCTLRTNSK